MLGRKIKVTSEMIADAKTIFKLMGVPVIESPGEA